MAGHLSAQVTPGGYVLGEVISALQKEIRRGNERDALYWAIEATETNTAASSYCWNRLEVIATEDIGPAFPMLPVLLATLRASYMDNRKRGNPSYRLFLTSAVLQMARSPKSRLVDDFLIAEYFGDRRIEIPDYALDKHTARGRAFGRGFDHFFSEGAIVHPELPMDGDAEYRSEARANLATGRSFKYADIDRGQRSLGV